jgi:3-phenylpropionate/trans-cinnamate dioxygenase ferredoxin reductase component
VLLVSVGASPDCAWLAGSGLSAGGVLIDAAARTIIPGVYAAGDAALLADARTGGPVASEHWEAAAWQGAGAARSMLGLAPRPAPLPAVWSDQHGIRLHLLGALAGSSPVVIGGSPDEGCGWALCERDARLVGALAIGAEGALPELRSRLAA